MGELEVTLSSTGTKLTMGFVRGVENTSEARKLLFSGDLPDTLLVKACLIPSPLVVAVAANKSALAQQRGNMRTRSVQTETLFNLSSSKNITESLKNFGGNDSDSSFVVCGFGAGGLVKAKEVIKGEWEEMEKLPEQVDSALLTKLHKLRPPELGCLPQSLCSRIAAKDAL